MKKEESQVRTHQTTSNQSTSNPQKEDQKQNPIDKILEKLDSIDEQKKLSQKEKLKTAIKILSLEYQKAQDSAEHHDSLFWHVFSIIFAGMFIALAFSLEFISKFGFEFPILFMSFLGLILSIALIVYSYEYNKIKRKKYKRCKNIELILGMRQHLDTGNYKTKKLISWIYRAILAIFSGLWLGLLISTLIL